MNNMTVSSFLIKNNLIKHKLLIISFLWYLLFLLLPFWIFCQIDTNLTSVKNIILIQKNAEDSLSSNPETSLKNSFLAYKLSIKNSDNTLITNSLKLIALSHKNLGNNYESIKYFKIFIEKNNVSIYDKTLSLNYLGELYRLIGQLNKSIEYHTKSLELAKNKNFEDLIPKIYINIGIVYRNIGDYKTARKYYNDALSISLNNENLINTLQAIGNWNWYLNNNDSALFYYNKAKNEFNKNPNLSKSIEVGILNNIGNAYRSKKSYDLAFEFYNKALFISNKINNNNLKAVILKNIGITHYENKNNLLAIKYLKGSNQFAKKSNLKRIIIENHHYLYKIYSNNGNYKLALENFIKFDNQEDSVFFNDNNFKISELEIKYKNKENQEIINNLKFNKEQNIKLFITIFSIILIIIIVLLYKQFKYHKKESKTRLDFNNELQKLNEELIIQNKKILENKIQISDSEILFRTIFEDSPLGKILLDPNGNILKINDALMSIIGFNVNKELILQNIFQFPFLKKSSILNSFSEAISDKKVVFGESNIRNNNGKQILLAYHISPILNENGKLVKIHAVATDITEEKRKEQILIESQKQLKELNATKDKFLSIIAHDIKNPFNAIMGFSNLLKDDYDSFTNEERMQFISNISQASEDVFNLLENLLKWSWTQSGKISFSPQNIDINDICNETLALVKLQAERKKIEIQTELRIPLMVFADTNMLKTVFRNIISNAIKFTPNEGKIFISYLIFNNKLASHNQFVQICIKDTGIGISTENLSKLFKIEEKITSKGTNGENGTGLGLILCKEFVNKNGGEIWVESEENNGSSFYFTIPMI